MKQPTPSDRELDILKVLWTIGESRVRDVHRELCPNGECAFTTVQTLLRIMAEKGLVKQRTEGRTSFFTPICSPERVSSRFLHKVFDGAMGEMVLSMLRAEDVSPEEMKELEQLIAAARKEKQTDDQ